MCGIVAIVGPSAATFPIERMLDSLAHRGPDGSGLWSSEDCRLGHRRLKILDISDSAAQPMSCPDHRFELVFNGEIYNYLELRQELQAGHTFRSTGDAEVLLEAFRRWGPACLDRLVGMFAFAIWDRHEHRLFAARDRFGVKPLFWHQTANGSLLLASEIKAFGRAGIELRPDAATWNAHLAFGVYDDGDGSTFFEGIRSLPAGHWLEWRAGQLAIRRWYDFPARVEERRAAGSRVPEEEALELLQSALQFRLRSDVPVGLTVSGGLDSALLLALLKPLERHKELPAFSFITGDPAYDELPWVKSLLAAHPRSLEVCLLRPEEVPDLALGVYESQDEPYGGVPTLAYERCFAAAHRAGVTVLLDGQGNDEAWAGYDYYRGASSRQSATMEAATLVQGSTARPLRPECLDPEVLESVRPPAAPAVFASPLENMQYRDLFLTKLPRALRFNDRISMRWGIELREPFLDHRLVEFGVSQPRESKIDEQTGKLMLRRIGQHLLPNGLVEAPKRPVQTPQREWLSGPLQGWVRDMVETGLAGFGGAWLRPDRVRRELEEFFAGDPGHSFFVWQWVSLGLAVESQRNAER